MWVPTKIELNYKQNGASTWIVKRVIWSSAWKRNKDSREIWSHKVAEIKEDEIKDREVNLRKNWEAEIENVRGPVMNRKKNSKLLHA